MAKLQLNNTDVIEQVSSTDVTYKFPGPNHTFSVKALNQAISGATNSTNDDANSDQLAIYNSSTKLWGISEAGYVVNPKVPCFTAICNQSSNEYTADPMIFNVILTFTLTDNNLYHYLCLSVSLESPKSQRFNQV